MTYMTKRYNFEGVEVCSISLGGGYIALDEFCGTFRRPAGSAYGTAEATFIDGHTVHLGLLCHLWGDKLR